MSIKTAERYVPFENIATARMLRGHVTEHPEVLDWELDHRHTRAELGRLTILPAVQVSVKTVKDALLAIGAGAQRAALAADRAHLELLLKKRVPATFVTDSYFELLYLTYRFWDRARKSVRMLTDNDGMTRLSVMQGMVEQTVKTLNDHSGKVQIAIVNSEPLPWLIELRDMFPHTLGVCTGKTSDSVNTFLMCDGRLGWVATAPADPITNASPDPCVEAKISVNDETWVKVHEEYFDIVIWGKMRALERNSFARHQELVTTP